MGGTGRSEREYVEQIALFFEGQGLPRMTGRVLGWLLVCEPAVQSSQDIAAALGASKGSISTSTRMLVAAGLVVKVGVPGERGSFFTIHADSWSRLLQAKIAGITAFRRLADQGIELLGHDADRAERLRQIRDFYAFMEEEFPVLFERWEQRRRG